MVRPQTVAASPDLQLAQRRVAVVDRQQIDAGIDDAIATRVEPCAQRLGAGFDCLDQHDGAALFDHLAGVASNSIPWISSLIVSTRGSVSASREIC